MADLGIGEGIIQDVANLVAGDLPDWASVPGEFLAAAIPAIVGKLAQGETPVQIAAPYVFQAIQLTEGIVSDLLKGHTKEDARRAADDALFALLEDLKFGARP